MDTFQFRVLPFGSLVVLVVIAWLVLQIRKGRGMADAAWSSFFGIVGGALLVAALVFIRRLPYAEACLNCGFQDRTWYSYALTFSQGFEVAAALAVVVRAFSAGERSQARRR